jgi:hypothetical protein
MSMTRFLQAYLPCRFFTKPAPAMLFPKLLLLLAACSSVSSALAQRTAIAPLVPVMPKVATANPLGEIISTKSPARPAAPTADQPSRPVQPQPVFLVDSHVIMGRGLAQINPQDIADIYVYKGSNVPGKWLSMTANGVIAITLKPHVKPKLKSKSLAALGRQLKLRGPVTYQLEGLPIDDQTLRVATADIAQLDTQQTAAGTVVNIHLAVPPPVTHPPGTILIRGVAGS